MKDKLKNTLEHEVELLGRSISVLAIAGLLVVGGASAALLTSFGTVSGDASVDQAITIGDEVFAEGEAEATFGFNDETTVAGETFVDTETINNNANVSASYMFVSEKPEGSSVRLSTNYVSGEVSQGYETGKWEGQSYDLQEFANGNVDYSVDYTEEKTIFNLELPKRFEDGENFAFIVDSDTDGASEFQVKYQDGWDYQEVEGEGWTSADLDGLETQAVNREEFTVRLPTSVLEQDGSDYGFAFQGRWNGNVGGFGGNNLGFQYPSGPSVWGEDFIYGNYDTLETGESVDHASSDVYEGETFHLAESDGENFDGKISVRDTGSEVVWTYSELEASSEAEGNFYPKLIVQAGDTHYLVEYNEESGLQHKEYDEGWPSDAEQGLPEGFNLEGTPGEDTEFVFTADKSALDSNNVKWAVRVAETGQAGTNFMKYPASFDVWSGDTSTYASATLGEVETLDSQDSQDYTFTNSFPINMEEGTYDVEVDVVPVTE